MRPLIIALAVLCLSGNCVPDLVLWSASPIIQADHADTARIHGMILQRKVDNGVWVDEGTLRCEWHMPYYDAPAEEWERWCRGIDQEEPLQRYISQELETVTVRLVAYREIGGGEVEYSEPSNELTVCMPEVRRF